MFLGSGEKPKKNENRIVQTAACLYLSLFINDQVQNFSLPGYQDTIEYTIDPSDMYKLQETGEIRIALAYTLRHILVETEDIKNIKPVSSIDSWRVPEEYGIKFQKPSFVGDARLDFALGRNLEHILSVCSIPVAESSDKIPLIALTCGDISGHRISTAASL